MKLRVYLMLLSFLGTTPLSASAQQECSQINSEKSLIQCVLLNAPALQDAKLLVEEQERGIDAQSQPINPRLEVAGDVIGGDNKSLEVGYYHTFEMGGKRTSRKNFAASRVSIVNAQLKQIQHRLVMDTKLDLLRLRQIQTEMNILAETIHSFDELVSRFKQASGLSPEQKASVTAFTLARRETAIHQKTLFNEQRKLLGLLELRAGKKIPNIESILSPHISTWPKLKSDPIDDPSIKVAQAEIVSAQASVQVQNSLSSADLEVGPKITIENGPTGQTTRLGFGLSLPLPIYHSNQGGTAQAEASKGRIIAQLERLKNRLKQEFERNVEIYQSAVETFKTFDQEKDIEQRHKELHSFIKRGVVEAAIVIEVHRQILAFQGQLHQLEQEGNTAYWKVLSLQGKILNKEIK